MTNLTTQQVAQLCKAAGFTGQHLVDAVAVCMAESGGRTTAVHVNNDQWKSVDRGLFQFNDHFHPEITPAEAFDGPTAVKDAYNLSKQGTNWSAWLAFTSDAYKTWSKLAADAVASLDFTTIHLANVYWEAKNNDVKLVQQRLIAKGLLAVGLDTGYFYTYSKAAYAKWQVLCGYTGADADGIPGRKSLTALGFNVL